LNLFEAKGGVMKVVKKVLIAILVIIVALVACYYAFPEKVAGYMMDAAHKSCWPD
jgi:sensor domain CHASE-containing protein